MKRKVCEKKKVTLIMGKPVNLRSSFFGALITFFFGVLTGVGNLEHNTCVS